MRIIVKGGAWKNTEDEVLKAAISKYGKNQWARISSLLVRKTPKQCKARWYEWLDPAIKKTEWSRDEDEKLLHLAKLMPTQWRTIAPIVGRTATQCLERYQQLLDEADARDDDDDDLGFTGPGIEGQPSASASTSTSRTLKAGEFDVAPEARPAKPDTVDMDEDEKEMLSEARARLANTQGKKAKRKARERQMEETRRLGVLQKRREMQAVGMSSRYKAKMKGMDYNTDIPFEKQPQIGFYNVSDEQHKDFQGQYQARVAAKSEAVAEQKRKQIEQGVVFTKKKKVDGLEDKLQAAREAKIRKMLEDAEDDVGGRVKLNLPAPQVGEKELDEIVKIGQARRIDQEQGTGSARLLSEYDTLNSARLARTEAIADTDDALKREARQLSRLSVQQTPLLGQQSEDVSMDGSVRNVMFTPNPLATPRVESEEVEFSAAARREKRRQTESLTLQFQALPKSKAGAYLEATLRAALEPTQDMAPVQSKLSQDAEERDRIEREEDEAERQREINRQSAAVKLGLPVPTHVMKEALEEVMGRATGEIQTRMRQEFINLVHHDSVNKDSSSLSSYTPPPDAYLESARILLDADLARELQTTPDNINSYLSGKILPDTTDFEYSPRLQSYVSQTSLSLSDYSLLLDSAERDSSEIGQVNTKLNKRLEKVMGGYSLKSSQTSDTLAALNEKMQESLMQLESFRFLLELESSASKNRLYRAETELSRVEMDEKQLQDVYVGLLHQRNELQATIDQKQEDEIMRLAEIENARVLASLEQEVS